MKHCDLILVAAVTGMAATCLGTETTAWSVLPCYGGGYVQNVVIAPSNPNVWYTYVDVGGPYRSDDAGRHWRPLHGNIAAEHRNVAGDCPRSLSVDPRDADSFVMCSGGGYSRPSGIFVSRDGGKSFRKTHTARFEGNGPCRAYGLVLARNPFNPDELLAGEDWDGGRVFTALPGSDKVPSGCSSKVLVDRRRLYYLTTGSGVFTRTLPILPQAN